MDLPTKSRMSFSPHTSRRTVWHRNIWCKTFFQNCVKVIGRSSIPWWWKPPNWIPDSWEWEYMQCSIMHCLIVLRTHVPSMRTSSLPFYDFSLTKNPLFLASQDALEVMLVSQWVSQSLSDSKNRVDWCDPGEWRYLLKTLLRDSDN